MLHLSAVSGFRNLEWGHIDELPAISVDETTAGERLVALKKKFNQLQKRVETCHRQLDHYPGEGIDCLCCILGYLLGNSQMHDKWWIQNLIKELTAELKKCIEQINALRAAYSDQPAAMGRVRSAVHSEQERI